MKQKEGSERKKQRQEDEGPTKSRGRKAAVSSTICSCYLLRLLIAAKKNQERSPEEIC